MRRWNAPIVLFNLAAWSLSFGLLATATRAADGNYDSATNQVPPERVQAAIQKLAELAESTLQSTGVPGIAIVVVDKDRVLSMQGFGVREAGKPARIDADTVFQVASMSKPITSSVLAVLVGEEKIDWDDRVIDHDPGFRMYDPYVTRELRLRDLLCHRSGLPDHSGDLLEDLGFARAKILHQLRYQPPDSSLRTQFAYTNFGYSEAAYAVCPEGKSWADLAEQTLFAPAGMNSTSYRFADYERATNRAVLHVPIDGQNSLTKGPGKWTARYTRQPDAQAPAGGVSTTPSDLSRWLRLQLDGGQLDGKPLIAADALAETHTPQIVTSFSPDQGRISSYGLGWIVGIDRGGTVAWKHSGAFALGMRTEVALLPAQGIGIAVLSNAAPSGIPEGLIESFIDLVIEGELQRDWMEFANRMWDEQTKAELAQQRDYSNPPASPSPPLALSAYTGKFENQFFGPIEFLERQGKLIMRQGPKPLEGELVHWDRDVFIYQPVGEMSGGPAGVQFSINPAGKADQVVIENLNIHGLGTFARQE